MIPIKRYNPPRPEKKFIAFGGGVNSVATTIMLFNRGQFYPVVFADTGAEHPYTYEYMDYFEKEFMVKFGKQIIRLTPFTTPYYYRKSKRFLSLESYLQMKHLVPLASQRFCTKDWKVEPCQRWAKHHGYNKTILSFAHDERERATQDESYPLVDEKITRQGCISIIIGAGLRAPKKSGCYFCPFKQRSSWRETYYLYPNLFQRAMEIEKRFIARCHSIGKQGHYLMHQQLSLESFGQLLKNGSPCDLPDPELNELIPCHCMF